jgi:hypothetical protein
MYKIMDKQFVKGLPIVNYNSHWSVMRAGSGKSKFLEEKFMSTFKPLTPQCKKRYDWVRVKAYPGPNIILGDFERMQQPEENDRMI